MYRVLLIMLIVMVSSQLLAQKIYKWVDENGQTHYSSTKPVGQETETLKLKKPPKASQQNTPEQAADDPASAKESEQTAEEAKAEAAAEEAAKKELAQADLINNRKQCELARKNHAALNATVRVSRTNANGETVRMTDDERVNALKEAQKGIKRYCQ